MAEMTKATIARIAKLLEVSKELTTKLQDVHTEIDNLLGGKAGIGEQLKAFEAAFDASWCSRYAPGQERRYVWNYVQDRAQIKRLLKTIPLADLEQRTLRYIRSEDPFFVRSRHGFGLFVRSVNQWAAEGEAPEDLELDSAPAVSDCKHTPRCTSDAMHTKKRSADLKAMSA